MVNHLNEIEEDVKLKIFWVQCISLFFLSLIASFILSLIHFNETRLLLDLCLAICTISIFFLSFRAKKLHPYHYLLLLASNLFIVSLAIILEGFFKVTVFSYFSLNIIFTIIMFDKWKRTLFVTIESLTYGIIIAYLIRQNTNLIIYDMLVQIIVSTCTMSVCFLTILKMYEKNADNLHKINNQLQQFALKDTLTNLWNREYMNILLEQMIKSNKKLSIVMLDIDHFKKVNDTYGHIIGDKVLQKLAHLLINNIPKNAYAIRYGGEEFLVILPEADSKDALEFANKIRKKVENELKLKKMKGKITISGGVKEYNKRMSKVSFINEADKNLYMAKESGRNRIVV